MKIQKQQTHRARGLAAKGGQVRASEEAVSALHAVGVCGCEMSFSVSMGVPESKENMQNHLPVVLVRDREESDHKHQSPKGVSKGKGCFFCFSKTSFLVELKS
jgi:hypothetical protein